MSTHSYIGYVMEDGTVKYIYCHSDGDPSWVGRILENFYTQKESVKDLINLGDISRLGTTPESCGWGTIEEQLLTDTIGKNLTAEASISFPKYCRDYKSRGDKDVDARTISSESEFKLPPMIDYGYLFINNRWYCYSKYMHDNVCKQKKERLSTILKNLKED